jgi:hypothetical protein
MVYGEGARLDSMPDMHIDVISAAEMNKGPNGGQGAQSWQPGRSRAMRTAAALRRGRQCKIAISAAPQIGRRGPARRHVWKR